MVYLYNASIFSRFTRTRSWSLGAWQATLRGCHDVRGESGQHQTLGCSPTAWQIISARALHRVCTHAVGIRPHVGTRSSERPTRRHVRRSPSLVERPLSRALGISCHHRPSHYSAQLDAQKKTLQAQDQDKRTAFRQRLNQVDAHDIVVLDECGSNLDLTLRYARSPRGQRAIGRVPRNTPRNTTLIAALTLDGISASLIMPSATNQLAFEAYVEHILAPTLHPGQLVVRDNLSAHGRAKAAKLIAARSCKLWFLPPYSPDVSPIEPAFAKLKQAWRTAGARTTETLYQTITDMIPTITRADALGFFQHCGYRTSVQAAQSL